MFLQEMSPYTVHFINGFHHMNRYTDSSSLIRNRTGNSLSNPPCSISTEFISFRVIELIHGFQKSHIPFLNQIKKRHSPAGIFFRNRHDKSKISIGHFLFRFCRHPFLFISSFRHFSNFNRLCQFHFLFRS